jgi:hypothetical protein
MNDQNRKELVQYRLGRAKDTLLEVNFMLTMNCGTPR